MWQWMLHNDAESEKEKYKHPCPFQDLMMDRDYCTEFSQLNGIHREHTSKSCYQHYLYNSGVPNIVKVIVYISPDNLLIRQSLGHPNILYLTGSGSNAKNN